MGEADHDSSSLRRRIIVGIVTAVLLLAGTAAVFALNDDDGANSGNTAASDADETTNGDEPTGRASTTTPEQGKDAQAQEIERRRQQAEERRRAGSSSVPGATDPGMETSGPEPTTGSGNEETPTTGVTPPTRPANLTPIQQAYLAAFDAKCVEIWSIAGPDGLLWDADNDAVEPYQLFECQDWGDAADALLYDTEDDARLGGAEDAAFWMAIRLTNGRLRNADGSKTWSAN